MQEIQIGLNKINVIVIKISFELKRDSMRFQTRAFPWPSFSVLYLFDFSGGIRRDVAVV